MGEVSVTVAAAGPRSAALITITRPTRINAAAGSNANGGTWPSQMAATKVAPGISNKMASETTVADVLDSTRVIIE